SFLRLKISNANELAKYIAGVIALTPASVLILVVDCIHIRIGHLDDFFFRCLESIALFNVHLYSTSSSVFSLIVAVMTTGVHIMVLLVRLSPPILRIPHQFVTSPNT